MYFNVHLLCFEIKYIYEVVYMEIKETGSKVYLICGKARHGKDTVASMIHEICMENNQKCLNLQFSAYIKEYAKKISDWDGSEDTKPRSLLQEIAVKSRKLNPGYTIKRMEEDINILKEYLEKLIEEIRTHNKQNRSIHNEKVITVFLKK